jgi:hypothetical protein
MQPVRRQEPDEDILPAILEHVVEGQHMLTSLQKSASFQ